MGFLKNFLQVSKIRGVEHYILADRDGEVIIHNIKEYKKIGAMVSFCASQAGAIARAKLKYMAFTRKSREDLIIFPVGNYSLGVIKDRDIQTVDMVKDVLEFLNGLDIAQS